MANWYGATRTNYFKVTDEERYQQLFKRLSCEDPVEDFSKTIEGQVWHAFGAYGDISFLNEDLNEDDSVGYDNFLTAVSEILTPDSVFVSTCIGNEKLRYLTGICYVVFPDGRIVSEDLSVFAHRTAKAFFGDDYQLYLDY